MNVILAIANFILAVSNLVRSVKENKMVYLVTSTLFAITSGIYFFLSFKEGDIVIEYGENLSDDDGFED